MTNMEMKQAAGCLLAGAMVGAAVVLLYAPQSGVRTNARQCAEDGRIRIERLIGTSTKESA